MTTEQFQNLLDEIRPILNKYEAKNVVIGVDDENGIFYGAYGAENATGDFLSLSKASMSCARLYQGSREKVFTLLEKISRGLR